MNEINPERLIMLQFMAANHGLSPGRYKELAKAGRDLKLEGASMVAISQTELNILLAAYEEVHHVNEESSAILPEPQAAPSPEGEDGED